MVSPPERRVQAAPSVKRDVSWEGLNRLVQDALASRNTRADAGTLSDPAVDTDRQLLDSLDGLKEDGALRWWNSTRPLAYRVTRADVRVYARMPEKIETTLGFTNGQAFDRIEAALGFIMAGSIGFAIPTLDKLPGPEFVRWFATASFVSLPFAYITLGLSMPEALVGMVNQVLFVLNRDYKERLFRHEAAHFLVGYLCGLPVLKYSVTGRLNAVQFAGQLLDQPMLADPMGPLSKDAVEAVERSRREGQGRRKGLVSEHTLNQLTVVGLAGVVAEFIRFGNAEGGLHDMEQLNAVMELHNPDMTARQGEQQISWGTLMAYNLLKRHEQSLDALVAAFERGASVVECFRIIEETGGLAPRED